MNTLQSVMFTAVLGLLSALPGTSQAHFIWLSIGDDGNLHVHFSESAAPDDPDLLKYAENAEVWSVTADGKFSSVKVKRGEESLVGKLKRTQSEAVFGARKDFGVMTRGDSTFLLRYYAKTGPSIDASAWQANTRKKLALDLVPSREADKIQVTAFWQGKPAKDVEVTVARPGADDIKKQTDKQGQITFAFGKPGMYELRARMVEDKSGKHQEKAYDEIRHYSTLALRLGQSTEANDESVAVAKTMKPFAAIPEEITSFGAAINKGVLYTYGGHTGAAHSYSKQEQGNVLMALKLDGKSKWEELIEGPHLQGLTLLSCGDQLCRIGGFTAKNDEGEDHDLWSQNSVEMYDPQSNAWRKMPSLPEPRSSFDAAVLGNHIYVIGGWAMSGEGDKVWHKTAWSLDFTSQKNQWEALPAPPFQRRALAVAVHGGKVYAIGGMKSEGGPTTRVDVYDPKTETWLQIDNLHGKSMTGFGCSSFATGGKLFVSTFDGSLQQLSSDGKSWKVVAKTPTARFFHRMLPLDESQLLMVGGANMEIGKFDEIEVIETKSHAETDE